eukprot:1219804-Amphidinium_carterae.1
MTLGYSSIAVAHTSGSQPSDHVAVLCAPQAPGHGAMLPKWITQCKEWREAVQQELGNLDLVLDPFVRILHFQAICEQAVQRSRLTKADTKDREARLSLSCRALWLVLHGKTDACKQLCSELEIDVPATTPALRILLTETVHDLWIIVREAEMADLSDELNEDPIASNKLSVLRSLYSAWKGQSIRKVIGYLQLEDGSLQCETSSIINLLTDHWRGVFEQPDAFDEELQDQLCKHIVAQTWPSFTFEAAQIQHVLKCVKDTAAGPDGVTYRILRTFTSHTSRWLAEAGN